MLALGSVGEKDFLGFKIILQILAGRMGKPEKVAGSIIDLASQEVAFVIGAYIAVDGGQPMQ
jgi:NAD(P)-dependent dehydrogenase (short-subunit alcohol dehydrogenase family)